MAQALALRSSVPQVVDPADDFEMDELLIFDSVPDHRDFGIVALKGLVAIYDTTSIYREGIIEGSFYVRENQRPAGHRPWQDWLRDEISHPERNVGPHSPLTTSREVVRAVRWPRSDKDSDNWAFRLASGFTDGPYYDWWFGRDVIGKVVGIYRPQAS